MGLVIRAKGFDEDIYDSGYSGFTHFRVAVAKAYNKEFGKLYEDWVWCSMTHNEFPKEDSDRINELANSDLNLLLLHSDCDGKLTPKECKRIYNVTKDLKCDYPQCNYTTNTGKNQLEVFNRALLHFNFCGKDVFKDPLSYNKIIIHNNQKYLCNFIDFNFFVVKNEL